MPEFWNSALLASSILLVVLLAGLSAITATLFAPSEEASLTIGELSISMFPTTETDRRLLLPDCRNCQIAIYFYRPNNGIGTYIVRARGEFITETAAAVFPILYHRVGYRQTASRLVWTTRVFNPVHDRVGNCYVIRVFMTASELEMEWA